MLKVMAVLRTLFLIFIVIYAFTSTPWSLTLPANTAALYDKCRVSVYELQRAAWFAIAWIAFETVVGWFMATRQPKLHERDLPRPGGEPPFAPPPHG